MFTFCDGCGWLNQRGDCLNHYAQAFDVREDDGHCPWKERPLMSQQEIDRRAPKTDSE